MAFDQSKIGRLTADLMDRLDNEFGDECEIGDVVLVAEILGPHGSTVTLQTTDARKHVNLGLLAVAKRALDAGA